MEMYEDTNRDSNEVNYEELETEETRCKRQGEFTSAELTEINAR